MSGRLNVWQKETKRFWIFSEAHRVKKEILKYQINLSSTSEWHSSLENLEYMTTANVTESSLEMMMVV